MEQVRGAWDVRTPYTILVVLCLIFSFIRLAESQATSVTDLTTSKDVMHVAGGAWAAYSTYFLNRHWVGCPASTSGRSSGLQSLRLSTDWSSPPNYRMQYVFSCNGDREISASERNTPWNDGGGKSGGIIYLDRHVLECGPGNSIVSFGLRTWDKGGWDVNIAYNYWCTGTYSPAVRFQCQQKFTPRNELGGQENYYLDRHELRCSHGTISAFALRRPSGSEIQYEYRCCFPRTVFTYIGGSPEGIEALPFDKYVKINNARNVFVLNFARDPACGAECWPDQQPASCECDTNSGNFVAVWQGGAIQDKSYITNAKVACPDCRFYLSLAGDKAKWSDPSNCQAWSTRAFSSISSLLVNWNLDGVDVNWENFPGADAKFADCVGQLVEMLKNQGFGITVSPFYDTVPQYKALCQRSGSSIDFVLFQMYQYCEGDKTRCESVAAVKSSMKSIVDKLGISSEKFTLGLTAQTGFRGGSPDILSQALKEVMNSDLLGYGAPASAFIWTGEQDITKTGKAVSNSLNAAFA